VAAGFLQDGASWRAIANSTGLFAWHRQTALDFLVTMRSEDGAGSGYAARDENDADRFDGGAASAVALQKALASRQARALEPGKYTVILEPTAAVDLVQQLVFTLDARAADEGRSPLSRPGGETVVGQRLVNESVSIWSDPAHADVPTAPWSSDGQPQERVNWIDKGVVQNLQYSRYWAQKQGKPVTPAPYGFIMAGGSMTLDELIQDTSKGILVTRFWYIRTVDPQTLLCRPCGLGASSSQVLPTPCDPRLRFVLAVRGAAARQGKRPESSRPGCVYFRHGCQTTSRILVLGAASR
jgi:predicted Zn-dependent protease